MEVHIHTHTERKTFTHHLYEFLMLFLAVFCGFLAENQQEHMVEHQREKQYIRSLQEDLSRDYLPKIKDKIKYIINTTLMNKLTTGDLDEAGINSLIQNILLTHDKTELIRFVNDMNEYRSQIRYRLGFVTHDKEAVQRLLTLIKKEYHLN